MPRNDKESNRKYCKEYYKKHRLELIAKSKKYNQAHKKQRGCCAICKSHQSKIKKALSVDHSHKTNKVRCLLCNGCNLRLGWFEKHKTRILSIVKFQGKD